MCRFIPFLIVSLFCSIVSTAQQKFTLQQCIDSALTNNISLKQNKLLVQSAEIDWKQSRANLLPGLNATANHGFNQGRSIDPFTNSYVEQGVNYANYGISSSVVVFNGFTLQNNIKQNALAHAATKMDLQQAKDNVTLNVILAYLQVLSNEDLVGLASRQAEVSRKQLERLLILDKEGAVSPSQVSDVKGQLMNDELSIINNKNALETAKLTLAQLMNIRYHKDMQLERIDAAQFLTPYAATANKVYETALEQLALVKSVELKTKSSEAALKATKGQFYPTLLLNGNLNTNYSSAATCDILINTSDVATPNYILLNGGKVPVMTKQNYYTAERINYNSQIRNNVFSSVNLGLRIPLFNSSFVRNNVKQAKIVVKNNELIEENTKVQLRQQIEQAYLNMTNAFEKYKVLQEQVAAYEQSFRAAEVRFNAGVGTSVDYNIAKNNMDRANINFLNSKYEYLLRKKVLDFYANVLQ